MSNCSSAGSASAGTLDSIARMQPRSAVTMNDRLHRRQLVHRGEALLATMARALHAPKGQLDSPARRKAVDIYLSGPDLPREPHGAAAIGGPDAGQKAELAVIRQTQRVRLVLERHHAEHRSEHLLARQRIVGRNGTVE